jgi:hypothetical protein
LHPCLLDYAGKVIDHEILARKALSKVHDGLSEPASHINDRRRLGKQLYRICRLKKLEVRMSHFEHRPRETGASFGILVSAIGVKVEWSMENMVECCLPRTWLRIGRLLQVFGQCEAGLEALI